MIRLYNTRTRKVEPFTALKEKAVSIYTCGPTVYSEPLIGNWVAYIRWDLLVRVLKNQAYDVTRVMNITDVGHLVSDGDDGEDKMQKGARQEGTTAWEVADRYTNHFLEGMTALNLLPPEVLPKATEHIAEQIELIKKLEHGGHTYTTDDGVYFDTQTFASYADFARLDLEALKAGARVEYSSQKRNPSDFALWKYSPKNEHRDMQWDSPWGKGFPGWHIECSAMAIKYLGETMDIHTGGIDHIPVHHTNEIAQSEAATGKRFANYWLHANFLLVNGTKISKSLGNGYTLDDLTAKGYRPEDFKMFVLQSHYRTESNFTWENLDAAKTRLNRWRAVAALRHQTATNPSQTVSQGFNPYEVSAKALAALCDDLNSPLALTQFEQVLDAYEHGAHSAATATRDEFMKSFQTIDDVLGLNILTSTPDINLALKDLIGQRELARTEKDWQRSDELRDILANQGIGVKDTTTGTRWYYL